MDVFFRDDDAGWDDARLLSLCDLFGAHRLPLDLAVIPTAWNRCTPDTARAVLDLGFAVLLREHRAEAFGLDGLAELPVHLDVARLSVEELDERFAACVRDGGPVGVMFHHAVMERDDFDQAAELLALLAHHPAVRARPMLMPA